MDGFFACLRLDRELLDGRTMAGYRLMGWGVLRALSALRRRLAYRDDVCECRPNVTRTVATGDRSKESEDI
jgi:hypothetical protein